MPRKRQSKKSKVVNLRLVKNEREEKRRREMHDELYRITKQALENPDLAGFVFVAIDRHGNPEPYVNTGRVIPIAVMPEFLKMAAQSVVLDGWSEGEADDYEPKRPMS